MFPAVELPIQKSLRIVISPYPTPCVFRLAIVLLDGKRRGGTAVLSGWVYRAQ